MRENMKVFEKTKMMNQTLWNIIRISLTLCALGLGGYALYRFEYFKVFSDLDNIIGIIPVAFVLIAVCGITALLWINRRFDSVSSVIVVMIMLSVALFPTALRGNWWLNIQISNEQEAKPNLSVYAPFSENSETAKLSGASTLTLIDNLPVLDGATALYPLYSAFAESAYKQESFSKDKVLFTNTRGAYDGVIASERDIIFVAGASKQQIAEAKAKGANLVFTPIGSEAFVFLVGKENPIDNISYQQIRNIYSGKTSKWSTLGWKDGGNIIAFQRPEGSGSQSGLQKIMGELPIQAPQPLPDASLIGANSLMKQISAKWKGVQPALGYSYKYYATIMYSNPDAKILKINGIAPTAENIQNGSYPFINNFYAVTNGIPHGNSKLLLDWILSPQGQELVEKTGYTPIN